MAGMRGGVRSRGSGRVLLVALLVATGTLAAEEPRAQEPCDPAEAIEPRADQLLHRMSDFLAGQRQFTVKTRGTTDFVEDSGQEVQRNQEGTVSVQRPDKLRVDKTEDHSRIHLVYDSRQLALVSGRSNIYATTPAPPSLDETLSMAWEQLGLDVPGSDLLTSDPYATLTEATCSGSYLGRTELDGVPVHHVVLRGREEDSELWIEDSPRALPRKYVITTRARPQPPQYSVELSEWNLWPRFSEDTFHFEPPPGATRVSFITPSLEVGRPQGGTR